MSFYTDYNSDDGYQQPLLSTSGAASTAAMNACFVCGSTEFYQTSSGETCCSNCFTQSQVQTEELEYEDIAQLMGRTTSRFSAGLLGFNKRSGPSTIKFSSLNTSKPLPSLEKCLEPYQIVLKSAAKKVCLLIGITESSSAASLIRCVKHIWLSYLSTWAEAAEFYGTKYPHLRFSMRDAFLVPSEVHRLLLHLKYMAQKRLEEADNTANNSTPGASSDTTSRQVKKKARIDDSAMPVEGDDKILQKDGGDESTRRRNRFAGYERRAEKEAKKFYPEYYFEDDFKVPPPKNQEDLVRILNKEAASSPILTKYEAALRLQAPSMRCVIAILHCALTHIRAGVSASQLLQFALNGSFPFVNAFAQALPQERQDELQGLKQFFTAVTVPQPGTVEYDSMLLTVISGFAREPVIQAKTVFSIIHPSEPNPAITPASTTTTSIGLEKKNTAGGPNDNVSCKPIIDPFVSRINGPLLACRIIQKLGFPQIALKNALSIMGICSYAVADDDASDISNKTATDCAMQEVRKRWFPPALKSAAPENLHTTADVIAVVVISCKLCDGWEYWTYKYANYSRSVSNKHNLTSEIVVDDKNWKQGNHWIPWSDNQLRLLTNGDTKNYLDFIDNTIFGSFPFRQEFESFIEWLGQERKNRSSSLIKEINSSNISLKSGYVAGNDVIVCGLPNLPIGVIRHHGTLGDDQEGQLQWNEANRNGMYKFYPSGNNPPHYSALVEFISLQELVAPGDIYLKVAKIEQDLLKYFIDKGQPSFRCKCMHDKSVGIYVQMDSLR